jgi:amidohydrolase
MFMADAPLDPSILETAHHLQPAQVELRRQLHAHPEVGLDLPSTQATLLDALAGLGLEITTGHDTTSVVAVLDPGRAGPSTLLRADMDALAMPEDTGLDFASSIDGSMHACGHDAHMAMLVGAARLLAGRSDDLAGRVVFMFQPGEEGYAGAQVMLDEGLIDNHGPFDRAFAIHIISNLPSGIVAARSGTMMASADEFRITVRGRGGHASMPHDAVDPVVAACEIVTSLQTMVTRRIPVFDPAVITVASVHAGTAFNVIAETAVIEGTLRAVSDQSRALALEGLRRVADHVAAAHLCQAEVVPIQHGYPVTVNDPDQAQRALSVAARLVGDDHVLHMPSPVMGAEDWSFILQRVPGAMAFLGAAPAGVEHPAANHSNRMIIDEAPMATGIALYAAMALT